MYDGINLQVGLYSIGIFIGTARYTIGPETITIYIIMLYGHNLQCNL